MYIVMHSFLIYYYSIQSTISVLCLGDLYCLISTIPEGVVRYFQLRWHKVAVLPSSFQSHFSFIFNLYLFIYIFFLS
jgi:hypothetical protein